MKKVSIFSILLALMLVVSACSSTSGVLMKEALIKDSEIQSYESLTTVSLDLQSTLMTQSFVADLYMKQIDPLNQEVHIGVNDAILLLLGLNKAEGVDENAKVKFLIKDGEIVIASNQDEKGINLGKLTDLMKEAFGEEITKAELEEMLAFDQEMSKKMYELMGDYLKEYNFSLSKLNNKGTVQVELPNGTKVDTEHIQVELTIPEVVDMLEYSIKHFAENKEFQKDFFNIIKMNASSAIGLGGSEVSEEEMAIVEEEFTAAIEEELPSLLAEIEKLKKELKAEELKPLVDNLKIYTDMYIGSDKYIYQNDLKVQLTYTPELAELGLTEMFPMSKGDTVTLKVSQKNWNQNSSEIAPVVFPEKLIELEELQEMENVEDIVAAVGEESILGQIAVLLDSAFSNMDEEPIAHLQIQLKDNNTAMVNSMSGQQELAYYKSENQVMIPFRVAIESMNGDIHWDGKNKKIISNMDGQLIEVDVKKKNKVTVNGEAFEGLKVEVKDGVSYISITPLARSLGWYVNWDGAIDTIFMVK